MQSFQDLIENPIPVAAICTIYLLIGPILCWRCLCTKKIRLYGLGDR